MPKRLPSLLGLRFGMLEVIGSAEPRKFQRWWLCQCDCGTRKEVAQHALRQGHTTSCGCKSATRIAALRRTHGMSSSPEFQVWRAILSRCLNQRQQSYPRYGGRGIHVCERWRMSFAAFYEDMGPRPSAWHSIDRINNDGHYEPQNCRWVTQRQQTLNTCRNVVLEHSGQRLTVAEWAERLGVQHGTLRRRLSRGWPTDRVLSAPIRRA